MYVRLTEANRLGGVRSGVSRFVTNAILHTEELNPEYWKLTLFQRAGLLRRGITNHFAAGSIYEDMTPSQLRNRLLSAEWKQYSHPYVQNDCLAFKAGIAGRIGVVNLEDLPSDTELMVDNRKDANHVSLTVSGVIGCRVVFTVLITKKSDEDNKHIVLTFHPGDPVKPSHISATKIRNSILSVNQALRLGFETAKIVP
ncbi:MAG TPA: hypothetical protein VKS81_06115 [Bacteroidota bacterium]|nr:hypothetical protein [Bacteroidota bacterium]